MGSPRRQGTHRCAACVGRRGIAGLCVAWEKGTARSGCATVPKIEKRQGRCRNESLQKYLSLGYPFEMGCQEAAGIRRRCLWLSAEPQLLPFGGRRRLRGR